MIIALLVGAFAFCIGVGGSASTAAPQSDELLETQLELWRAGDLQQLLRVADSVQDPLIRPVALATASLAKIQLGEYQTAMEWIRKAVDDSAAQSLDAHSRANMDSLHALLKTSMGHLESARELAESAVQRHPSPFTLTTLAQIHLARGENEKAGDALHRALDQDPRFAMAYKIRGEWHARHYRGDESVEDLKKAIELDPDFLWAQIALGYQWTSMYELEKAESLLREAQANRPQAAQVQLALSFLYQIQGDDSKAIAAMDRGRALGPKTHEVRLQHCYLLQHLEQWEEAQSLGQALIQDLPQWHYGHIALGDAMADLEPEQALEHYARAAELNPTHHRAWFHHGMTCFRMGEYDRAVTSLERSIQRFPSNWTAHLLLGQNWAAAEQHRKAISSYNQAIQLLDDYGLMYALRAKSRAALGEHLEAEDDYRRARELGWSDTEQRP